MSAVRCSLDPLRDVRHREPSALDTERVVVARETLARMVAAVAGLSPLEREALARVANGDPYSGEKSIDNALVRARHKLRKAAA